MLPATFVSKTLNAMKLKTAAQTHGRARRQHARRDDRRDGVRRVVKAVDEVESERQSDHGDQRERSSGVLQHDPFEDVRDVFTAVGRSFEVVVDVAPLEDIERRSSANRWRGRAWRARGGRFGRPRSRDG